MSGRRLPLILLTALLAPAAVGSQGHAQTQEVTLSVPGAAVLADPPEAVRAGDALEAKASTPEVSESQDLGSFLEPASAAYNNAASQDVGADPEPAWSAATGLLPTGEEAAGAAWGSGSQGYRNARQILDPHAHKTTDEARRRAHATDGLFADTCNLNPDADVWRGPLLGGLVTVARGMLVCLRAWAPSQHVEDAYRTYKDGMALSSSAVEGAAQAAGTVLKTDLAPSSPAAGAHFSIASGPPLPRASAKLPGLDGTSVRVTFTLHSIEAGLNRVAPGASEAPQETGAALWIEEGPHAKEASTAASAALAATRARVAGVGPGGDRVANAAQQVTTSGGPRAVADDSPEDRATGLVALLIASALALTLPLLHRLLSRKPLLDHPLRSRLYELVAARPGIAVSGAARAAGVSGATAAYHLRLLESAGLVVSDRIGNRRGFFPNGSGTSEERRARALLEGHGRALLLAIRASPSAPLRKLATASGMNLSAAYFCINRLEREGLLSTVREPRRIRYEIKEPALRVLESGPEAVPATRP